MDQPNPARRGTVLDEKNLPDIDDDMTNLRHERPQEWARLLKEKRGIELGTEGMTGGRRTVMEEEEDEEDQLVADPTEERHHRLKTRDPATKEPQDVAGSAVWHAHVKKTRDGRGYDAEREKPAAQYLKAEKPKRKRAPRKKGAK